jgi:hypothetical protein
MRVVRWMWVESLRMRPLHDETLQQFIDRTICNNRPVNAVTDLPAYFEPSYVFAPYIPIANGVVSPSIRVTSETKHDT